MANTPPTSLAQALDFQPSSGPSITLQQLPSDIGIGNGCDLPSDVSPLISG